MLPAATAILYGVRQYKFIQKENTKFRIVPQGSQAGNRAARLSDPVAGGLLGRCRRKERFLHVVSPERGELVNRWRQAWGEMPSITVPASLSPEQWHRMRVLDMQPAGTVCSLSRVLPDLEENSAHSRPGDAGKDDARRAIEAEALFLANVYADNLPGLITLFS